MKKLLSFVVGITILLGVHSVQATEYSTEMQTAYEWAYENGIIGESSIDNAGLYDAVPNPSMRAILLNFATYLGLNSGSAADSFGDLFIDEGSEAKRTNFGTALSRLLRGEQYNGGTPYYKNHLEALKAAGIITDIDNPEDITEIRGYVLIMLMRISENYNEIDCEDPLVKVACATDSDECPEICKPIGTLTNELAEPVIFNSNETTRKTIFSGTYTALKDSTLQFFGIEDIDEFMLDNDPNYFTKRCENNNTSLEFYLFINGEEIDQTITIDEACEFGYGAAAGVWFDGINVVKGERYQIKVETEVDAWTEEDDIYKTQLILQNTGFSQNNNGDIKANMAPIRIVDHNTFSILTGAQEKTVRLKGKKSTLAEFTIKPSYGADAYLSGLVLEINGVPIEDDDVKLIIDYEEYEATSSENGTLTYKPRIDITSKGVRAKIILEKDVEYEDYTISTNIKSINRKTINESFSKRFVSTLVYISKQENKGDYTEFTLGVKKSNNNYYMDLVCLLTGSSGAGICFPGRFEGSGSYENGYVFTVNNSDSNQDINYISYLMNNSEEDGWADSITIEREEYPDYFKLGTGDTRKIFAKEVQTSGSSGKSSGGGGGGSSTTKTNVTSDKKINNTEETTKEKNKTEEVENKDSTKTMTTTQNYNNGNPSEMLENGYTREMNNAFKFAHDNGITTTNSIEKAMVDSPLTRIAMAKMLSNYAINVLGKQPDTSKGLTNFNDVTEEQNSKYGNAVTLAYQLGIMGQNINSNNFRPNDTVTRAEFATVLSRMLYGTNDGQGDTKYFETHMTKLFEEGIITKKDPGIKEKRGYVMLMLMRATDQ